MRGGSKKGRVCVTGGTGFVASSLIKLLLDDGFSVNATIRLPPPQEKNKDISYLTNLPGESENLTIFNADLSDPDTYSPAIKGCVGVFHVAHPIDTLDAEPEESVTQRAINGVIGILSACLEAKTVKRVVHTSSAAAIVYNEEALAPPHEVDESSWTDVGFARAMTPGLRSYVISKTLAEKAAFEYAEKHGLDLVAVNPSFVTDPFITPSLPSSVAITLALVLGNTEVFPYLMNLKMVHVNDLARAQIHLLECRGARGRYIVSATQMSILEMSEYLDSRYPDLYKKDENSLKGVIEGPMPPNLSTKKLLETGFEFKYGFDEIYDDAIRCCKEKGIL